MRMRAATLSIVMVLLVQHAVASSRVRIPTLEDLGTIWVGDAAEGGLEYFRLELNAQGTGVLTVQYLPKDPAVAYRVKRTTLERYKVSFDSDPIDSAAEPIYIRGEATPARLTLEVGGIKRDWKRTVTLQRHSALMDRLRAVTDRAEAVSADRR